MSKMAQKQINKSLLLLKQDQVCSNNIMCKVLSELEKLALISGYKGNPIFSYYSNSQMNEKEIIDQISFQMTIFQTSFQGFLRNHNNKYEYPENLPRQTIINIINNWIAQVNKTNPNNSIFFIDFFNIINGKSLSQTNQMIYENLGKNEEMNKRELKKQMNNFANATAMVGERLNKVEEEIALKGNYSHQIKLNQKREDNPMYQRLNKNRALIKSYNDKCDKNLLYIMAYLEFMAIYFDDSIKPKYQYVFTNNTPVIFTIKENIYQKLYEFSNYYLKLEDFDGYEFPTKFSIEKIENQINNWAERIPDQGIKSIFFEVLKTLKKPIEDPGDVY